MAHFLFVHGSWHGAWCWGRLTPLLETEGHQVTAIDLPAHGEDRTPAYKASLDSYARAVEDAAGRCSEPPIVVGHSMGGVPITLAASRSPELVSALVYLAAFTPLRGDSLSKMFGRDRDSLLHDAIRFGLLSTTIRHGHPGPVFYAGCSEEDVCWASERLCADPLRAAWARLPTEPSAALPRTYVECTNDRAVTIGAQRAMYRRAGIDDVITMDTDHSPFLSDPDKLARHLCAIAERPRARAG